MNSRSWDPGERVRLDAPGLSIRSLRLSDLTGDVESVVGGKARTAHVWKPDLSARDYLEGLITHCDQKTFFVFGIFNDSGEMVGYRKSQVVEENDEKVVIPTTVVGDPWARQGWGQLSGPLHNWFFVTQLGVGGVHPRIYESNRIVWELAERHGYELLSRSNEKSSDGTTQKVRVYRLSKATVLERADASFSFSILQGE